MKLIGQLLVNGMLSSDLFVVCCEELLRNRTKCLEALEALVALITVAGPKFDTKAWQCYKQLEKVFEDMKGLTKDKPTAPRLRFLIRDVLDARDAGWPNSTTPKTLAKADRTSQAKASNIQKKSSKPDSLTRLVELTNPKVAAKPWKPAKLERTKEKDEVVQQYSQPQKQDVSKVSSSLPKVQSPSDAGFDVVALRRTIASVLSDLATDKNIPVAVQRIRSHEVPTALQANEYVDIITRIVEERRGAVRRCQLAFLAALVAGENSAFDSKECLFGVKSFFEDVYNELCIEVARLPGIMRSEFMPALLNSFPSAELNSVVPVMMHR
jgi:hypothetical protein